MYLSAMLTSLPVSFEAAARQSAALGFTHVDIVALADRPTSHLEALAETGLVVSCASIGRHLPEGCTLDAADLALRRTALEVMQRQIADAAHLGATHGYVVSGMDASAEGLARFAEMCALLADFAGRSMVKLCVEPIPGRALASAAAALNCLQTIRHPNLFFLLDVGHCLISGEDPGQVVSQAGARLGYVHLDDNDGAGDLHWPLLTGRLTREMLAGCLGRLRQAGYPGALALELNPSNPEPVEALRQGKTLVEELLE
jgi:sugar phosphate isomerase/epimerase